MWRLSLYPTALLKPCCWPLHHYSLVGPGIEAFLPGEAVHATHDPAVHLRPLFIADLSPLSAVFHLQKALGDGNPLPLGIRGPDPHVLHLHCQTLQHGAEEMFHHCLTAPDIIDNINIGGLWKLILVHLDGDNWAKQRPTLK